MRVAARGTDGSSGAAVGQPRGAWAPRKLLDRLRASLRQKRPPSALLSPAFYDNFRFITAAELYPELFLYRRLAAAYSCIIVSVGAVRVLVSLAPSDDHVLDATERAGHALLIFTSEGFAHLEQKGNNPRTEIIVRHFARDASELERGSCLDHPDIGVKLLTGLQASRPYHCRPTGDAPFMMLNCNGDG